MTIQVVKQTFIENIYKNFYDIISAIGGAHSVFYDKIFPCMPDVELNSLASYPMIILETPQVDMNQFDFGKNVSDGTVNITIYTTSAKSRDQLMDMLIYALETNKGVFANMNLHQVNFNSIITNEVARGKIKVHMATLPVIFKFYSQKTYAY